MATDIAARGLDIEQLPYVVNFELPNVAEDYVHRIGRTGRAEATGMAVSLVCIDEAKLLKDIEKLLKKSIPLMAIEGYEPNPSIKAEPIQKPSQRNDRRSPDNRGGERSNSNKGHSRPRRQNTSAGKGQSESAGSPWRSAQKRVRQGRSES